MYCTVADVELNLSGFVIDTVRDDETTLTDAQIELFIAKADAYINSVLATVYTLPFSVTIPFLTDISTDLACYYVLRRSYTQDSMETSSWVKEFLENAETKLKAIMDGDVSLIDSDGNVITFAGSLIDHNNAGYTPTFDIGDPLDWEVDQDRLSAIEDSR